jgi:hypothetical protein
MSNFFPHFTDGKIHKSKNISNRGTFFEAHLCGNIRRIQGKLGGNCRFASVRQRAFAHESENTRREAIRMPFFKCQ